MNVITDPIEFGFCEDEVLAVVCLSCRSLVLASPAEYAIQVMMDHTASCKGRAIRIVKLVPPRGQIHQEALP